LRSYFSPVILFPAKLFFRGTSLPLCLRLLSLPAIPVPPCGHPCANYPTSPFCFDIDFGCLPYYAVEENSFPLDRVFFIFYPSTTFLPSAVGQFSSSLLAYCRGRRLWMFSFSPSLVVVVAAACSHPAERESPSAFFLVFAEFYSGALRHNPPLPFYHTCFSCPVGCPSFSNISLIFLSVRWRPGPLQRPASPIFFTRLLDPPTEGFRYLPPGAPSSATVCVLPLSHRPPGDRSSCQLKVGLPLFRTPISPDVLVLQIRTILISDAHRPNSPLPY